MENQMNKLFVTFCLFAALIAPALAAPVGAAQLKGTYSFSIGGTTEAGGYYVKNVWHYVNGNCPTGQHCQTQVFNKLTVGTILFDGLGHAKFLSIVNYDPSGEPNGGGPVVGTVWPYSVSGFNGQLGTAANGASLRLGSFNASGISTVVLLITDLSSNSGPTMGVGTLQ